MSRSKTPTLPWAIPMYQHMQESLNANLADSSLSPRMHKAIRIASAKLNHYYDMAKLNHFSVLATGEYSILTTLRDIPNNAFVSSPPGITALVVQIDRRRLIRACQNRLRIPLRGVPSHHSSLYIAINTCSAAHRRQLLPSKHRASLVSFSHHSRT